VIHHYPADQAALARLDPQDPRFAERFEVSFDGVELANGYHELADADEQRRRFETDRKRRSAAGLRDVEPDPLLLGALDRGLPDCCGVAVGFDRVLMCALGADALDDVISFSFQ
jgi:lysyl-tRNA synthetase class 2